MRTKHLFLLVAILLMGISATSQQILFTEDFETGADGWVVVNGNQSNQWVVGTAAVSSGTKAMYVSTDNGVSNSYSTNNISVIHYYKDITFPETAGLGYTLSFDWRCVGEANYDDLKVYLVDTDVMPRAGNNLSQINLLGTFSSSDVWQRTSLPMSSVIGKTKRLVFSWRNNGADGLQPPAAIDNVVVESRVLSTDASITSIFVNEELAEFFSGNTYKVEVENDVDLITIAANAAHGAATVVGDIGQRSVSVGKNFFSIVVIAEDEYTSKDYTLEVTRIASSDTSLACIFVNENLANHTSGKMYVSEVECGVEEVAIVAIATHEAASVGGDVGNKPIVVGTNNFNIVVIAEDGVNRETYNLEVTRPVSTDTSLRSISVNENFARHSLGTVYGIAVENEVEEVNIVATAGFKFATVNGDIGYRVVSVGVNTFSIVVTAEDGINVENYTLIVTRAASDDAYLKDLSISSGTLSPEFDPEILNYSVNVENEITRVILTAEKNHASSAVSGDGVKYLQVGDNAFVITVMAEDGSTQKEYRVVVVRDEFIDPIDEKIRLSSLIVSAGTLVPEFNPNKTRYSLGIPDHIASLNVWATAENTESSVAGIGHYSMSDGRQFISVRVTATDESQSRYIINIVRDNSVIVTSVDKTAKSSLKVYPNPTAEMVYVEKDNGEEVYVYNLHGKLLLQTHNSIISLQNYPSGIYLLRIGGRTTSVVKQ